MRPEGFWRGSRRKASLATQVLFLVTFLASQHFAYVAAQQEQATAILDAIYAENETSGGTVGLKDGPGAGSAGRGLLLTGLGPPPPSSTSGRPPPPQPAAAHTVTCSVTYVGPAERSGPPVRVAVACRAQLDTAPPAAGGSGADAAGDGGAGAGGAAAASPQAHGGTAASSPSQLPPPPPPAAAQPPHHIMTVYLGARVRALLSNSNSSSKAGAGGAAASFLSGETYARYGR